MIRTVSGLVLTVAIAACAACARDEVPAPPVATPSVSVSRAEVPAGAPVEVTYRFEVARDAPPFDEDYLVFAHFLDADGEQLWTDDHQPDRPTSGWDPGNVIEYTRTMFVPRIPYVGVATVEVGLYSPTSGERLPLVGQDDGLRAYPVASFRMASEANTVFVVFRDGWHPAEAAGDPGLEWRWSRKEGVLTFRNPGRDADLFLQADQPVNAFTTPQRVEVRLAGSPIDSFELPAGEPIIRRIALPAGLLGGGETAEVTVAVDRTFVPAEVPSLRSADPRELGIRVFRAYVEPK